MKKIALSGIQTTGSLHLGNYLGSIANWLKFQEEYNCFFFLADLHSITVDQDPAELRQASYHTIAIYLASGICPKKSTIFLQSQVSYHAELAWLLNCVTPMGWMKRMTQYKDKAGKNQESASVGLFDYPVLMAADILLYNADVVPVGDDQKQHIELARDIASAVNRKFDKELLIMPEPMILGPAKRVMSLKDGLKKMSKSDPSDASRINLTDTNDMIMQKIRKAKTDAYEYISYDPENRPEFANLLNIFASITGSTPEHIAADYRDTNFSTFKEELANNICNLITPIREEYNKIILDKIYLDKILANGRDKASARAESIYKNVKDAFGFI